MGKGKGKRKRKAKARNRSTRSSVPPAKTEPEAAKPDHRVKESTREDSRAPRSEISATSGGIRRGMAIAPLFIVLLSVHIFWFSEGPFATKFDLLDTLTTVAVFAGVPALIAFGGLGRNLARREGFSPLMRHGALLGLLVGLSLGILAVVPTGAVKADDVTRVLAGAALLGAFLGSALGLWSHSA